MEKLKRKAKISKKAIIFMILAIALVIGAEMLLFNYIFSKKSTGGPAGNLSISDFYSSSCTCLMSVNACPKNYQLNGDQSLCMNSTLKSYTNPLDKCLKYKCGGSSYTLNDNTGMWHSG